MDTDLIIYLTDLLECWNNLLFNVNNHIEFAEPIELVDQYSLLLQEIERSRYQLAVLVDEAQSHGVKLAIDEWV